MDFANEQIELSASFKPAHKELIRKIGFLHRPAEIVCYFARNSIREHFVLSIALHSQVHMCTAGNLRMLSLHRYRFSFLIVLCIRQFLPSYVRCERISCAKIVRIPCFDFKMFSIRFVQSFRRLMHTIRFK